MRVNVEKKLTPHEELAYLKNELAKKDQKINNLEDRQVATEEALLVLIFGGTA